MFVNVFVPLISASVPEFGPLIDQVLARLLPVSVFVPAPPLIVPLMLPVAESVKASLFVPPVKFWTLENAVVVFSVPVLPAVMLQAFAPSVAASVFAPAPPLIEPLKLNIPAANVNVSLLALPTRASIDVAFMPATVTALAPVMLHAVTAFGPVSVSVPVPPVSVSMPVKVVVAFSVPAFAPEMLQALVPDR